MTLDTAALVPKAASIAIATLAVALAAPARAQYATSLPPAAVPGLGVPSQAGGFLIGADDCASPHTNAGTGDVFGVAFDLCTATTGATGQAQGICLFFGTTGINNDVWFDWTANASGIGRFSTCGQTSVDTKAAIWDFNGSATCPVTILACSQGGCGLQTVVDWPIAAGVTYTIQLGTFPGAACGTGTFSVEQLGPLPCGQYDSGATNNSLGLTAGGEIGWIHSFNCLSSISGVETAYGSPLFPGSVTNGAGSRIAVYDDVGGTGNPTGPHALLEVVNTVVVSGGTGILNPISFTMPHVIPGGTSFVLATADHIAGQFPGPMDQNNPVPEAWVAGNTAGPGSMDLGNLNNNPLPPSQMQAIGFPAAWLLRGVDNTQTFTPLCFAGPTCPCGPVPPGTGAGCPSGLGVGATLSASGVPSVNLVLTASNVTSQPGLFFMGDTVIGGGSGVAFGDGLRCCGVNVVRLEVVSPPPPQPTSVSTSVPITVLPGQSKCFQYWYRTPGGTGACGNGFNLSNAVLVP